MNNPATFWLGKKLALLTFERNSYRNIVNYGSLHWYVEEVLVEQIDCLNELMDQLEWSLKQPSYLHPFLAIGFKARESVTKRYIDLSDLLE